MEKQYLSLAKLKAAYAAYKSDEWRTPIEGLLKAYCTYKDGFEVKIPQKLIDKLIKEGTDEQKKYAESLGIILKENRNAFVERFDLNELSEISTKLFGDSMTLQIAYGAAISINRGDLCGRSFFVHKSYKVKLINTKTDGTIIEILKK